MQGGVDEFVKSVAPKNSKAIASVRTEIIFLACLPMLLSTDVGNSLQIRVTACLLVNIIVRLQYPSAYFPLSASAPGWHAHPLTARLIAFVAEFGLYETWAVWVGLDFWGNAYSMWLVVLVGEIVSTLGVVLQSEVILFIEDSIWTFHAGYMCLPAYPQFDKLWFFASFCAYMVLQHLPRRFAVLLHRQKGKSNIWQIKPMFIGASPSTAQVKEIEFAEKAWVVPMLLGQPLLTTLMYMSINKG